MTDSEIEAEIRTIVKGPMRLSEIGVQFFERHPITDPALFRRFWNISRPMLMEVPTLPGCFTEYALACECDSRKGIESPHKIRQTCDKEEVMA